MEELLRPLEYFVGALVVASIARDAVRWLGELHSQNMNFQTLGRSKMAAEYFQASSSIVALMEEVVEQHHPDLAEARIGVLMRDVAPRSQGRRVFGKAKKVGPELKVLLPHDFIIWFAQDVWEELDHIQRRALVDHELCHCTIDNEKAKMKSHDLNEFLCIFERYGFWWPQSEEAERVFQAQLGLGEVTKARIEALSVPEGGGSFEEIWGEEEGEEPEEGSMNGNGAEPVKKVRKGRKSNAS